MISRPPLPRAANPWLLATLSAGALAFSTAAFAQSYPAWAPDVYYTAGTVVSYNGHNYKALVNQTDYSSTGWNPTNASLWTDLGAASGPAPAPAPTPAPTPDRKSVV